jgi:uncharacterized protein (DUF1800 family)
MHKTLTEAPGKSVSDTKLFEKPTPRVFPSMAVLATLTACGGGTADNVGGGNTSTITLDPPTPAKSANFLAQAGFGGTLSDIDQVLQLGFEGWLDKEINQAPSQSHIDWLIEKGFAKENSAARWPNTLWRKLFSSPDTLRQRVVLAYSQIFVVSINGLPSGEYNNFAIASYLDMLERHAFSNFRDLLEAVTLSTAMGEYLNMRGNQKAVGERRPDENYAREIMQLFTIGLDQLNNDGTPILDANGLPVPSYDEPDIEGLAAVFTGWNYAKATDPSGVLPAGAYTHLLPMVLDPNLHSMSEKKFLGVTIPADTGGAESLKVALDTLFNHANTGPFIATRLIQRLVTSNPPPAYVGRVAAVFANNGQGVRGDMSAVVKAILLDPEAHGQSIIPPDQRGKLREPVLRLLQWGRTFGAYNKDSGLWNLGMTSDASSLGQMPMAAPSVFNFYTYDYVPPNSPLNNAGLVAPEFQLVTEPTSAGYLNFMRQVVNNTWLIRSDYAPEIAMAADTDALVNHCNLLLTGNQLSQKTTKTIVGAIAGMGKTTDDQRRNRVKATILLIMCCPEYLVQKI